MSGQENGPQPEKSPGINYQDIVNAYKAYRSAMPEVGQSFSLIGDRDNMVDKQTKKREIGNHVLPIIGTNIEELVHFDPRSTLFEFYSELINLQVIKDVLNSLLKKYPEDETIIHNVDAIRRGDQLKGGGSFTFFHNWG